MLREAGSRDHVSGGAHHRTQLIDGGSRDDGQAKPLGMTQRGLTRAVVHEGDVVTAPHEGARDRLAVEAVADHDHMTVGHHGDGCCHGVTTSARSEISTKSA